MVSGRGRGDPNPVGSRSHSPDKRDRAVRAGQGASAAPKGRFRTIVKASDERAERPPRRGAAPTGWKARPRSARHAQSAHTTAKTAYPATASALQPSAVRHVAVRDGVGAAQAAAAGAVDARVVQQRADRVVARGVGVDGADVGEGARPHRPARRAARRYGAGRRVPGRSAGPRAVAARAPAAGRASRVRGSEGSPGRFCPRTHEGAARGPGGPAAAPCCSRASPGCGGAGPYRVRTVVRARPVTGPAGDYGRRSGR